MPAATESFSRGGCGFGGKGTGWEWIAASGASATPGSRRPGVSPGISRVGAPSTPGDGNRERALIRAKASIRKQVTRGSHEPPARIQRKRSRHPSPPEKTPPQPSAATAGRAGPRGWGAGRPPRFWKVGLGKEGERRGGGGRGWVSYLCPEWVVADGRGLSSLWAAAARLRLSLDLAAHRLQRLRRHGVSSNHQPRQQGHHTHDDVKRCYGNR